MAMAEIGLMVKGKVDWYRREWQAFKKKYPAFDGAKDGKNLGPKIDKYYYAEVKWIKSLKGLIKDKSEKRQKQVTKEGLAIQKPLDAVAKALTAYRKVAITLEEMGGENKGILKDYDKFAGRFLKWQREHRSGVASTVKFWASQDH